MIIRYPQELCRYCNEPVRQCGPGCRYAGWTHSGTEKHRCKRGNNYGYPLGIIRAAKVWVSRNDNGDGPRIGGWDEMVSILLEAPNLLADSQNLYFRNRDLV